jgi:hypothetical protein
MATALEIMSVLREKLWTDGAHAWLYEVANATGGRVSRFADALVFSCWPSRGLWIAGIEAKVSRSDWTRERDDPEKSVELQKYCRYWWLVTTPKVAKSEEISETWGHIEVDGAKHKILKPAPELTTVAPTMDLLASIARNSAKNIDNAVVERATTMIEFERTSLRNQQEKLIETQRELGAHGNLLDRYRALVGQCDKFKCATGLDITSDWKLESSIETIELAKKLTEYRGLKGLRKDLLEMAEKIRELDIEKGV